MGILTLNILHVTKIFAASGHIVELYCVPLSNAALFCQNYAKFYFNAKHLEKGLNRRGGMKFLEPFFSKSSLPSQYRELP